MNSWLGTETKPQPNRGVNGKLSDVLATTSVVPNSPDRPAGVKVTGDRRPNRSTKSKTTTSTKTSAPLRASMASVTVEKNGAIVGQLKMGTAVNARVVGKKVAPANTGPPNGARRSKGVGPTTDTRT